MPRPQYPLHFQTPPLFPHRPTVTTTIPRQHPPPRPRRTPSRIPISHHERTNLCSPCLTSRSTQYMSHVSRCRDLTCTHTYVVPYHLSTQWLSLLTDLSFHVPYHTSLLKVITCPRVPPRFPTMDHMSSSSSAKNSGVEPHALRLSAAATTLTSKYPPTPIPPASPIPAFPPRQALPPRRAPLSFTIAAPPFTAPSTHHPPLESSLHCDTTSSLPAPTAPHTIMTTATLQHCPLVPHRLSPALLCPLLTHPSRLSTPCHHTTSSCVFLSSFSSPGSTLRATLSLASTAPTATSTPFSTSLLAPFKRRYMPAPTLLTYTDRSTRIPT